MMGDATIKVTLRKSGIGFPVKQKKTLLGLGLKKLNSTRVLKDTPAIRGMINKVSHLVEVERSG
jgi:large subunit ribosomal protein L30